jgi:hypothetical protein
MSLAHHVLHVVGSFRRTLCSLKLIQKKLELEVLLLLKTIKEPDQRGSKMLKILENQNKVLRL